MVISTPGNLSQTTMVMMFLLTANVLEITNAQVSSLFQCQSSSDQSGLVYTPNIPDFYFNDTNAANFMKGGGANLTDSVNGDTYIFTISSESRNCSGTVRSIQYCYRVWLNNLSEYVIFTFSILSRNGESFTKEENPIVIESTPQDSICTRLRPNNANNMAHICCDSYNTSWTGVQLTSSDFTFGITVPPSNLRPLVFADSTTEYNVMHYQTSNESSLTVIKGNRVNGGFFLLRFMIAPTVETSSTVVTPASTVLTQAPRIATPLSPASTVATSLSSAEQAFTVATSLSSAERASTDEVGLTTPSIGAYVGGVIGGCVTSILLTILLTTACIFVITKTKQKILLKIKVLENTHVYASIDEGGGTQDVEMQEDEA